MREPPIYPHMYRYTPRRYAVRVKEAKPARQCPDLSCLALKGWGSLEGPGYGNNVSFKASNNPQPHPKPSTLNPVTAAADKAESSSKKGSKESAASSGARKPRKGQPQWNQWQSLRSPVSVLWHGQDWYCLGACKRRLFRQIRLPS